MVFSIRFAHAPDLSEIEKVENAADQLLIDLLRPERWEPAPTGESRIREPGYILVAETGHAAVAGFVHVLETEDGCHLEQLSVAPAHTRQGIGRALVTAAMREAAERGCPAMTLRTYADVPWNAPFYQTMGFAERDPATPFQRALVAVEESLDLDRYGRRVLMIAVPSEDSEGTAHRT